MIILRLQGSIQKSNVGQLGLDKPKSLGFFLFCFPVKLKLDKIVIFQEPTGENYTKRCSELT